MFCPIQLGLGGFLTFSRQGLATRTATWVQDQEVGLGLG